MHTQSNRHRVLHSAATNSLARALRRSSLCGLALGLLAATTSVHAQAPGDQDPTFATGPDTGSNGDFVSALALQPNGQVLVVGGFSAFRGVARSAAARLNADGSLDTFNPGLALTAAREVGPRVSSLALQGDGKVIVAGHFTVLGQPDGGAVARLNADGSLDATFNVGGGAYYDGGATGKTAVAVLPNGQLLVGGSFQSFNGHPYQGLVRLNADGSVDPSFNPGGGGINTDDSRAEVTTIIVLPGGQILIGGFFATYNGVPSGGVARLNADGTLDPTFQVGQGTDSEVFALGIQADGKILVGGSYHNFDGAEIDTSLLRLNTDGSLDTGYIADVPGFKIYQIDALLIQGDGRVLITGSFNNAGGLLGSAAGGLLRLNADGTLDTSFDGSNGVLHGFALALQPDGKALVAFDQLDGNAVGPGDVLRVYDLPPTPSAFFAGQVSLGNGVYYLAFPENGNIFGYYAYLSDPRYVYHFDLGYEYVFDAADGHSGVYLYDFASNSFFYTSPVFPFPYLYDFTLNTVLYYYPDPNNPGHYNTDGYRFFYDFATGGIISK